MQRIKATIDKEEKRLRHKIADVFCPADEEGNEKGTKNFELHGHKVKIVRKLNISLPKDAAEQLIDADPDLADKVYPEKSFRELDKTAAAKALDELEEYVTTSQGLPEVTFTEI